MPPMARADLTVQAVSRAGLTPAFTAAVVDGHMFPNDGRTLLRVKNSDAAAKTVTFAIPATVDGQAVTARQVTIPANTGDVVIGPWPAAYNQASGKVWVDYSAVTGVTVAAVAVPPA
ncbi:hypothetical protein [Embleya sp. NPDC059237]|uniref:hypothetical protein n=1 Tax=Embleya sp. NPDC059237 TaxID=3346784 RepID=UPI003674C6C1